MSRRLVAIGECMIEMAPAGGADLFRMAFSGDTFNTAWYAQRLLPKDWRVDYVTAVGTDPVSDRMVGFIAEAGIGTGHIARVPDRGVGLYLISLDRGERSFTYWRSHSAARLLAENERRLDAALDGAGRLRTLVSVVAPMIAPGIAATSIIVVILSFNEFLLASGLTLSDGMRTLTVGISLFQRDRLVNFGQMAAASLAGILPIYVIALLMQKHLVEGLAHGGVK